MKYRVQIDFSNANHAPLRPRAFDSPVLRVAVMLYSAAVLFVWLGFATHAQYWLPYRFYPLA